jgi:hypothetical protein
MTIAGAQVKAARTLPGWTQPQIAGELGISVSQNVSFEAAKHRYPCFRRPCSGASFSGPAWSLETTGGPVARGQAMIRAAQLRFFIGLGFALGVRGRRAGL